MINKQAKKGIVSNNLMQYYNRINWFNMWVDVWANNNNSLSLV